MPAEGRRSHRSEFKYCVVLLTSEARLTLSLFVSHKSLAI